MIWIKIVAVYLGLMLLRGIFYLINYLTLRRLYSEYQSFIRNQYDEFDQKVTHIRRLFKKANIEDVTLPHVSHEGYGQILSTEYSAFSNISTINHDVVSIISRKFNEAIGEFKLRMRQSINPIFWIEFLLKLPQFILGYFNVDPKTLAVKIIQIIYWCIGIVAALDKMGVIDVSAIIAR